MITKKLESWFKSIEDPELKKLMEENTIVTGGCIASMLLKEQIRDFDIYLRTKAATKAIAEYYVKRFTIKDKKGIACSIFVKVDDITGRIKIFVKSAGIASAEGTEKPYQYFEREGDNPAAADYVGDVMQGVTEDPGQIQDITESIEENIAAQDNENNKDGKFKPIFLSTNAITLAGKIQIVLRFYGEPEEIHKNYDFIHCTNYYTSWDKKLVINQQALESLITKELRYTGSLYPVCSMFRLRKFINRQWSINAGQMLRIAMQISALDLTNIDVLEDQLMGVDAAYFVELMRKLRENDPTKVNSAYLIEILDRIF